MNPSEAKVFSSGIASLLSSKRRSDVSYSKINQVDDFVEFSDVHFQKDGTSLCAKLCFALLALTLLIATVATSIFLMNLRHFAVEVHLEKGNMHVYRFEQECTIVGNGNASRSMSIKVTLHVINSTESDCWFGVLLSFLKPNNPFPLKDNAFLARVTNSKSDYFQDGMQKRFKVYGPRETDKELLFYVYNIFHQLLPAVKVKLYEFVLSKVSSSSRRTVMEDRGFLPDRVHVMRTLITNGDFLTVMAKAGPGDFQSFSDEDEFRRALWTLSYDETAVVNRKTGMVKRNEMFLSGKLPIGADFTASEGKFSTKGLAVAFKSTTKLLDESQAKPKPWNTAVKDKDDLNHPLFFPAGENSLLMYFAPSKSNSSQSLAQDVMELLELSKSSPERSSKLPPMINILHDKIPKSWNVFRSDSVGDIREDDLTNNENEDQYDGDDEESENSDDSSFQQSWLAPNFAPFGFGYEVKRRRSVETKTPRETKKTKIAKRSQAESKESGLDMVWNELTSSSPRANLEPPRVIQTSIMTLDFRSEIDYKVHAEEDDDNDDGDNEDDIEDQNSNNDKNWDVTTAYRIVIGQYRIEPLRRFHTLEKLRGKLPRKGKRKRNHWRINAGDFIMCVPLFFIQRLCAAIRLKFDVTITYELPRLSLLYPVEMTVHIGQTVITNATLSVHASTWFHESGIYTEGTIAMANLPVRLLFKEEAFPEWCVTGNLQQKIVRINSVPLSSWNCSLGHNKQEKKCTGQPKDLKISSASFDSKQSSTEGTTFDNWHYPVSCLQ